MAVLPQFIKLSAKTRAWVALHVPSYVPHSMLVADVCKASLEPRTLGHFALISSPSFTSQSQSPAELAFVFACVQAAQEKHLLRDLSPILLCALVNNNARCYNESMDFAEHMNEILPDSLKVGRLL